MWSPIPIWGVLSFCRGDLCARSVVYLQFSSHHAPGQSSGSAENTANFVGMVTAAAYPGGFVGLGFCCCCCCCEIPPFCPTTIKLPLALLLINPQQLQQQQQQPSMLAATQQRQLLLALAFPHNPWRTACCAQPAPIRCSRRTACHAAAAASPQQPEQPGVPPQPGVGSPLSSRDGGDAAASIQLPNLPRLVPPR